MIDDILQITDLIYSSVVHKIFTHLVHCILDLVEESLMQEIHLH